MKNIIRINISRANLCVGIFLFLFFIGFTPDAKAQDKLFINANLSAVGGSSSNSAHNISYYLYGGLRYKAQDYYLSLSLPVVFNSYG